MVAASENRRQLSRSNVNQDIFLLDETTGKKLGKLVNIHQEGLMIISQADVLVDNLYQATLITKGEEIDPIAVGLDCMWQQDLEQGEGCWAGFRIISISDQALQKIQTLIQRFSSEVITPSS